MHMLRICETAFSLVSEDGFTRRSTSWPPIRSEKGRSATPNKNTFGKVSVIVKAISLEEPTKVSGGITKTEEADIGRMVEGKSYHLESTTLSGGSRIDGRGVLVVHTLQLASSRRSLQHLACSSSSLASSRDTAAVL